jgi:hypothetical protein
MRCNLGNMSTSIMGFASKHRRGLIVLLVCVGILMIPIFVDGIPDYANSMIESDNRWERALGYCVRAGMAIWALLAAAFYAVWTYLSAFLVIFAVCGSLLALGIGIHRIARSILNRKGKGDKGDEG